MPTYNTQNISPVSRRINQSGGIPKYAVCVMGTGDREVKLPAGDNAGAVEGIALEGGLNGDHIPVQTDGDAIVRASGAITKGARVNTDGTTGKVKAVDETGATIQGIGVARSAAGADNDLLTIRLSIGESYSVA